MIRYPSLGPGDLRDHADVVIAAFHRLPVAHVLDEQAAGPVVRKGEHGPVRLGDAFQPSLRRIGIRHPVAQRVGLREQVAVLIVGVARYVFQRVRHLDDVILRVIRIGRFVPQLVRHPGQPVHPVVLVLLRVAFRVRLRNHVARQVVGQALLRAVGIGHLLQQAFRRVGKPRLVPQRVRLARQVAQRVVGIRGFRPIRRGLLHQPPQQVVFVPRHPVPLRDAEHIAHGVIFVCGRKPRARRGFHHPAKEVVFRGVFASVGVDGLRHPAREVVGKRHPAPFRVRDRRHVPRRVVFVLRRVPVYRRPGDLSRLVIAVDRDAAFGVGHAQRPPRAVILVERYGLSGRGNFGHVPQRVIGKLRLLALRVGDLRDKPVFVIAVGGGMPVGVGFRCDASRAVIAGCQHAAVFLHGRGGPAVFVIAQRNGLTQRVRQAGQVAVFVVAVPRHAPVCVQRIDEASHAVISVAGDRSVRRGFGNHAAQCVVGPGGYIAQRVRRGEQVAACVVGIGGLCAHGVRHANQAAQQVVCQLRYAAQRVHLPHGAAHAVVFHTDLPAARQAAPRQVARQVISHGLRNPCGVGDRQRQAQRVIGVFGHAAQSVGFGEQVARRVIGAGGDIALRIGHGELIAVWVVGVGGAAAQSIRRAADLPVPRIGRLLRGFVGEDRLGQAAHGVVFVAGHVAQGIGHGRSVAQAVIRIADCRSIRKRLAQQVALCVVCQQRHMAQRVRQGGHIPACVIRIAGFVPQRVDGFDQLPVDVFVARHAAQRVGLFHHAALVVIGIAGHAAVGRGFGGQVAVFVIRIGGNPAVEVLQAGQVVAGIVLPQDAPAVWQYGGGQIARRVIGVGGDVSHRVRFTHDFSVFPVGKRRLPAQRVHNSGGALAFVIVIGDGVALRVGRHGMAVGVFHPVASAGGVRLGGHAVLTVIAIEHLTLAVCVIPGRHAALAVVLIPDFRAVLIGEGDQVVAAVAVVQLAAARQGELYDMPVFIHLHQQLFLAGRQDLDQKPVFIPHQVRLVLAAVPLDALEQAAGGKGVHRAVRQRDAVLGMRKVVGKRLIFRAVAYERPVRLMIEDDFAAVRAAVAHAAVVKQAQVLAVFRGPLCAKGPVAFAGLRVIGAHDLQRACSQVG